MKLVDKLISIFKFCVGRSLWHFHNSVNVVLRPVHTGGQNVSNRPSQSPHVPPVSVAVTVTGVARRRLLLVPVYNGPLVLVQQFHRFIQQHVLYCIGQTHAGSSLRVHYLHWASSGHSCPYCLWGNLQCALHIRTEWRKMKSKIRWWTGISTSQCLDVTLAEGQFPDMQKINGTKSEFKKLRHVKMWTHNPRSWRFLSWLQPNKIKLLDSIHCEAISCSQS